MSDCSFTQPVLNSHQISVEFISFLDLKPCVNTSVLRLWQSEQDKYPHKKLHKIFPKLNDSISCPGYNRREETAISELHMDHTYDSLLFLMGEEPPASHVRRCLPQNIFLFCSDFTAVKEQYFTAWSLMMLFEDMSLDLTT